MNQIAIDALVKEINHLYDCINDIDDSDLPKPLKDKKIKLCGDNIEKLNEAINALEGRK